MKFKHQLLIITGCILYIISFFLEIANYQPYSTAGLLLSPILTIIGLIYWLKFYKTTKGNYPNFFKKWKEYLSTMKLNPFNGIIFLFKNVLSFWTLAIVFGMISTLVFNLIFKQSNAFRETQAYCKTNKEILLKTGKIKYFGIIVSGKIKEGEETGDAEFYFTIVGAKGNFSAKSELTKMEDKWTVDNVQLQ